jgi:hypothetical protein
LRRPGKLEAVPLNAALLPGGFTRLNEHGFGR